MIFEVKPISVIIRTGHCVSSENIVGMSDPNSSRRLISVEQTPGCSHIDDQVIFYQIVCLSSIFNENSMSKSVVNYIVLNSQIMHSVNCHSPIVSVVNCIVPDVRIVHSAYHVEMNWISS